MSNAAGPGKALAPVPQAIYPTGPGTSTATEACMNAWLEATAQKTVGAACEVLQAMAPKCVEELALQAMMEEAVAGATGLEDY